MGDTAPESSSPSKASAFFSRTFAALAQPNYRIWFWSQMCSFFGSWMQSASMGYLMFELTGSASWLGWMSFASGLATLLFMMYGGVLCDRFPKRRIIFIAESSMMLISGIAAVLILTGVVRPWQLLATAFLMGAANAFDTPARQSFVSELVPKEDLSNAIALGATMFNMAVALGPAIGGMIYALVGPGWCFLINALSFIGVLVGLCLMRFARPEIEKRRESALRSIGEAARILFYGKDLRTIIFAMWNGVLFGLSLNSLFPAWVGRVLHGDSTVNGFLQSARGLGALLGAILLASRGRFDRKPMLMRAASFAYPIMLLVFSRTDSVLLSLLLIALAGVCQIQLFNLSNAMTQMLTPEGQRGTVMGIYNLIFNGFFSIGGLIAGFLADRVSIRAAYLILAGACLAFAIIGHLSNRDFAAKRI